MKANELMIGDFVTFKDCQNDEVKPIVKIWQLNEDNEAFASIDSDDSNEEIEIDDEIIGIPLTSEILEKNGFKQTSNSQYGGEYTLADDYYDITAKTISDGIWQIEYECIEMSGIPSSRVNISHIHELQQFLRLCGVQKYITL